MNKPWVLPLLFIIMLGIAWMTSSSALEIVATTTGLLSVWLTARERISAWPVGLVNVACFFYMFEDAKLYADMTLQLFFFALSVYGWAAWLRNRGAAKVRPTRRLTLPEGLMLAVLLPVVTLLWGWVLQHYTDASIPYADAFIATLSLVAQYLLSSKVFENWLCWIVVDILSVAMYAYKELYALTFLYVIFLAIAIAGHLSWRQALKLRSAEGGIPV